MPNAKTERRKQLRTERRLKSGAPANLKPGQRRARSAKNLPPRQVWEIQDEETSYGYECFRVFRDMNPLDRSIAAVAKIFGKATVTMTSLASDYNWASRAAAWDFHIEQARLEMTETYQLDMLKRHTDICVALIDKVKQRLDKMSPKELGPRDVIQWIDITTKIERLSRGMANDAVAANLTQINVSVDNMTKLSDEDLEKIIANEKKVAARRNAIDMSALPALEGVKS